MGMKKSAQLMSLLALGAMLDPNLYNEGINENKPKNKPIIRKPVPFNKQENIVKMIADYKLIKAGESKKGKIKQSRILNKIQEFLDSGQLTKTDIK